MFAETGKSIPLTLPSVTGWKEVLIKESGEKLVPLGPFSDNDQIFTRSIYVGEGTESPYINHPLRGSLITMFVREGVAEQLKFAQFLLPNGMYLIVFDSYRLLEVQQSLFDKYFGDLQKKYPDWDNNQLLNETQKFVSLPSADPTRPSPHNTGGAVDVAVFRLPRSVDRRIKEINEKLPLLDNNDWQSAYLLEMGKIALIREHIQMFDYGTPFDWGGPEATLNYLERLAETRRLSLQEEIARQNRSLLYHTMTAAGFEPYEEEWWHYNSKRAQMGAKTAGLPFAEYGAINLSAENLVHEEMRSNHRLGSIRMFGRKREEFGPADRLPKEFDVAFQAVLKTGDIRFSGLPEAAIISPS